MEIINFGDRVSWTAANGTRTGVVVSRHPLGAVIRLDNGKIIVATRESVTKVKQ